MAIFKDHNEFLKHCKDLVAEAIRLVEMTTGMNAEQWCLECDLDEQEKMNDVFIEYFGEDEYARAWTEMFRHYGI